MISGFADLATQHKTTPSTEVEYYPLAKDETLDTIDPMQDGPEQKTGSNLPEFSVSEISNALKRTVEDTFSYVRVRGELSGVKVAASGHMYADLKDDKSVLNVICWRGSMSKLSIKPEDGLEVICAGRLTTYPGRSNYQMVIESMELAGEGALLKMLEERRKKLAAEGLFAAERKKARPFIPNKIGVVTSPTGSVIRDIIHRLRERFPRHVIVWPARVQGEGAAAEIEAGIRGFNAMPENQRPDLIIVARGGGSLEDLMPFNDEGVVRAAAESVIPLISAVGHETDTTLIDYAADLRAPTPTGAAEVAVPRRDELLAQVMDGEKRLFGGITRLLNQYRERITSFARGLKDPLRLLEQKQQAFDFVAHKLGSAFEKGLVTKRTALLETASKIRHPKDQLQKAQQSLGYQATNLQKASKRLIEPFETKLKGLSRMLESLSFERVLDRGYAVVMNAQNTPISTPDAVKEGDALTIKFKDKKELEAIAGKGGNKNSSEPQKTATKKPKKKLTPPTDQGDLF